MSRHTAALLVVSAATLLMVLAGVRAPFATPFVAALFLVCPGVAVNAYFDLATGPPGWVFSVCLSCAIDAVVATAMLYAGLLTPVKVVLVLALLTSTIALVSELTPRDGSLHGGEESPSS